MAVCDPTELSGLEKASVLLMALGTSASAEVIKYLSQSEIERISAGIVNLRQVEREVADAVVSEFQQMRVSQASEQDGKAFALQLLEKALGEEKAGEVLERASGSTETGSLEFLARTEAADIAAAIEQELPQIIGLVLSNLIPEKAASVLSELPEDLRAEAAIRVCSIGAVDADVISAMWEALRLRLASSPANEARKVSSGPRALVEILNNADRETEEMILGAIRSNNPEVADQVRKMMFLFDDIVKLDGRSVQFVVREVDQEDLRLAMKYANESVTQVIFANMSERAVETLKEDLELLTAPKQKEMEAAQQRIAATVRRLLSKGLVMLNALEEEQAA